MKKCGLMVELGKPSLPNVSEGLSGFQARTPLLPVLFGLGEWSASSFSARARPSLPVPFSRVETWSPVMLAPLPREESSVTFQD